MLHLNKLRNQTFMEHFHGLPEEVDALDEEREFNKLLSYEERINILYLSELHNLSSSKIGHILGMKYSTVRAIILTFKRTRRINKLLTLSAKKQILKRRQAKTNY